MKIDDALANTKLSRMTSVKIHNMIRGYMQKYNAIHHKRVGRQGMVVEIDECPLHSSPSGVGSIEAGELWWMFGGICRQTHEMFAMVVENRKSDTLSKAVFENVESGSSIYSDCWKAYNQLS